MHDFGRKLCAEEWARYCGRKDCADAIAKFSNTKRFCLRARVRATNANAEEGGGPTLERANSLPDLLAGQEERKKTQPHKRSHSLRKKIKKILPGQSGDSSGGGGPNTLNVNTPASPFAVIARCVSTPALPGGLKSQSAQPHVSGMKRPVSVDNIPRVEVTIPYDEDTHAATRMEYPMCSRRRIRRNQPVNPIDDRDPIPVIVHTRR
jgi:hypothetical protein